MTTYAWTIDSTDADSGTMIVSYTNNEKTTALNIPVPDLGADIPAWIDKFAPRSSWQAKAVDEIVIGATGEATIELPVVSPAPQIPGAVNEQYLRTLIRQIIDEMNAAPV